MAFIHSIFPRYACFTITINFVGEPLDHHLTPAFLVLYRTLVIDKMAGHGFSDIACETLPKNTKITWY